MSPCGKTKVRRLRSECSDLWPPRPLHTWVSVTVCDSAGLTRECMKSAATLDDWAICCKVTAERPTSPPTRVRGLWPVFNSHRPTLLWSFRRKLFRRKSQYRKILPHFLLMSGDGIFSSFSFWRSQKSKLLPPSGNHFCGNWVSCVLWRDMFLNSWVRVMLRKHGVPPWGPQC